MFTDFDEGESHFSQADLGTRNLRMWAVLLVSMTDQDLTGKKLVYDSPKLQQLSIAITKLLTMF